ncbi:MAG: hypothetical protein ABI766_15260 [Gemmatimonadales bacterium]
MTGLTAKVGRGRHRVEVPSEIAHNLDAGDPMARKKTNRIAKAVATLAATLLVEKGVEAAAKAMKKRRARREVAALASDMGKRAKRAAKVAGGKAAKLGSAARERVPAARKKTARNLVRIAKAIEP